jgi:hypothetical protein
MFGEKSSLMRTRRKRLLDDFEKEENDKLKRIFKEFEKNFALSKEQIEEEMLRFVGNLGVTGLTAKAFINEEDKPDKATSSTTGAPGAGTPVRDIKGKSFGLAYNFGQVTVGADKARTEFADGISIDYKNMGVAYAVNKNLSVSYNQAKANRSDKTVDEKIQQYGIGYNLGPVMASIEYDIVDSGISNTGPTAGQDAKVVVVKFGTNF